MTAQGPRIQLPAGGVVVGVGTDIIEVARVQKAVERHGERFLCRIFTGGERAYCLQMRNPYPHLAVRFAAKEAVAKAFTTGIGAELGWTSIEIIKGEREQPLVRLDEKGRQLLQSTGASSVLVSLSHTENYAMAVAVVLKEVVDFARDGRRE